MKLYQLPSGQWIKLKKIRAVVSYDSPVPRVVICFSKTPPLEVTECDSKEIADKMRDEIANDVNAMLGGVTLKTHIDNPTIKQRFWQHDETGRTCKAELSPGQRWHEVKTFVSDHEYDCTAPIPDRRVGPLERRWTTDPKELINEQRFRLNSSTKLPDRRSPYSSRRSYDKPYPSISY